MRSRQLESALTTFVEEAAVQFTADTAAGEEVPFEIVAQPAGRHRAPLYCYRPLTGAFIEQHAPRLATLPSYPVAARLIADVDGLDRYLASRGVTEPASEVDDWAAAALRALLDDVFADQTEFELRPGRLEDALCHLEEAAIATSDQVVVVATVRGLALSSAELALGRGLVLAKPSALRGAPQEAVTGTAGAGAHVLAVVTIDRSDGDVDAISLARARLRELLRALRLFGDGRIALGEMAWSRVGSAPWRGHALGPAGRPRGTLVVTVDQEDELRAFCNLVNRRAPQRNEVAWALARFEMGCDRARDHEALTDYLAALRALLEPEGPASGLLPGRVAALCAVPEERAALARQAAQAIELEHSVIIGAVAQDTGPDALVSRMGDHLRALLRDVICGHLDAGLDRLADELLLPAEEDESGRAGASGGLTGSSHRRGREPRQRAARADVEEVADREGAVSGGGGEPTVPDDSGREPWGRNRMGGGDRGKPLDRARSVARDLVERWERERSGSPDPTEPLGRSRAGAPDVAEPWDEERSGATDSGRPLDRGDLGGGGDVREPLDRGDLGGGGDVREPWDRFGAEDPGSMETWWDQAGAGAGGPGEPRVYRGGDHGDPVEPWDWYGAGGGDSTEPWDGYRARRGDQVEPWDRFGSEDPGPMEPWDPDGLAGPGPVELWDRHGGPRGPRDHVDRAAAADPRSPGDGGSSDAGDRLGSRRPSLGSAGELADTRGLAPVHRLFPPRADRRGDAGTSNGPGDRGGSEPAGWSSRPAGRAGEVRLTVAHDSSAETRRQDLADQLRSRGPRSPRGCDED